MHKTLKNKRFNRMSHTLQNIEDSESESRDGSGYLETM
jgi:hypothetical protein